MKGGPLDHPPPPSPSHSPPQPSPPPAAPEEAEKKRRRRPNRRNRQNLAVASCGSVDGFCGQNGAVANVAGATVDGGAKASGVAFSSMPNIHLESGEQAGDQGAGSREAAELGEGKFSNSCPLLGGGSPSLPVGAGDPSSLVSPQNTREAGNHKSKRKYYDPHWPEEAVKEALEKGHVFRSVLRVNAHNRLEAYCTVDGLPIDILINGAAAQNRAVEGDIVAVMLEPVAYWMRLKGPAATSKIVAQENESSIIQGEDGQAEGAASAAIDSLSVNCGIPSCSNILFQIENGHNCHEANGTSQSIQSSKGIRQEKSCNGSTGQHTSFLEIPCKDFSSKAEGSKALEKLCAIMSSCPSKRPTGRVVSIIERSPRRDTIIGFLSIQQSSSIWEVYEKQFCGQISKRNNNYVPYSTIGYIILRPIGPKFSDMAVPITTLPATIMEKVEKNDETLEMVLVAARLVDWTEDCLLPQAHIVSVLGRGGEIETQIAAIMLENNIISSVFSPESLSCLPVLPWKIPSQEIMNRKDLRNLCTFTIDPSSAIDLDDALSVEKVSDGIYRVGVHIADVSFFVLPDSALDAEARDRSTSVYVLQHKLPMLPPLLSEELGSLNPGVDRLTFSIMWDINQSGSIVNQWIGRSIIRSCCKLSYECAQDIIDGALLCDSLDASKNELPKLPGQFQWKDVVESVLNLHEISKKLKENRFEDGALVLDSAKLVLLFDECGDPYDGILHERKDSNFLVEEFMLLANKTVAEVISRTYPEWSLLRRHPEPNLRKVKEFRAFCNKHGFDLDTSSSARFHNSLSEIKERLKNDPVLFDILVCYASKPMQLASYFCTGDLKDREDEWAHYSLAVPFYTHFTSPLRRYPDILVHRTLSAVVEAEKMYQQRLLPKEGGRELLNYEAMGQCFTGLVFEVDAAESKVGREALNAAALKYKLPGTADLSEIAAYCNDRKLASRHAEEAGNRVYIWALLRKKETLICEARVMGLGPRFMSIYIHKLAIERRIYYSEVEGLSVEWLETTSTLVLDLFRSRRSQRRGWTGNFYSLEDVALVVSPSESTEYEQNGSLLQEPSIAQLGLQDTTGNIDILPAVFPLTAHLLSTVPVALHAVGGDDGPVDVGVRLFMTSYF